MEGPTEPKPKKPADENPIVAAVLILIVFAAVFALVFKLAGDHRSTIETYLEPKKEQPWPF